MCSRCDTIKLCERIARQIKNIDDGGAVSLSSVRDILDQAHTRLTRVATADALSTLVLEGKATLDMVGLDRMPAMHSTEKH